MTATAQSLNSPDNAFELLRSHRIDSLNIQLEEYRHRKTGARHIHLACDKDENVFMVALRTVPQDSTGVAHVLEHTALCGSERYPVRDPFFMMIRRSLNTFMNAMTSSDWTAYPFASQNRKDFDNLLNVYLDAVFFSRLDPLDFAQEGHRLEFAEPGNPDSPLTYKGVVFNEMKGAMSSVPAQLWQTLCKYLYPSTTYHYNSGGDPEAITDLSYQQLKNFYRTHYHPGNAIFMTFGDIPAAEHQQKMEELALHRFDRLDKTIAVPPEKRFYAPIRVEEAYPYSEQDDNETVREKTHIVMGWLLGQSTNLVEALEAQLIASVLFDNSASPLQQVLETTDLGQAPSPLCGLDDSQLELTFVCGIEGSEPERAAAFEQLVLDTLETVAKDGIPTEDVEASLHQLELQQREVGGDSYPYGLQLILTALTAATHRGDPIELLDLDPAIQQLRENIQDPDYIKNLIRRWLLDNPHRVRLTLIPDTRLSARKQAGETAQLEAIRQQLSEQDKATIVQQAAALQARQEQEDEDLSILPKVGIEDIPPGIHHIQGDFRHDKDFSAALYPTGTNGLTYQQAIWDLPPLSEQELQLLPWYSVFLTELGMGELDYLAVQKRQSQIVGSLSSSPTLRATPEDAGQTLGHLVLSAKALAHKHAEMTQLMAETFYRARFAEPNRMRELIAQIRARREQSITGNGHILAMNAASAAMTPLSRLNQKLSGLEATLHTRELDDSLKNTQAMDDFAARLQALHQKITHQPVQFLLVSDEARIENQYRQLQKTWRDFSGVAPASLNSTPLALPAPESNRIRQAWLTNTQVNFCAKAFPTVPMTHADAAPLTVLGGFLRNGYLHRLIREQGGAYGGGAQQDNHGACFRFFSYRDPRLADTLNDFDQSVDWLLNTEHKPELVEEAILGVVSSIDRPGSPAGEAKQAFHAELNGRTLEKRETFRNRVLQVTADDLKRVADTYLAGEKRDTASSAVITARDNRAQTESLNLDSVEL